MLTRTFVLAATAALVLAPILSHADTSQAGHCAAWPSQPNSKAEILKLEKQWSQAYWTGHAAFLECLYAPDFVSINPDGKPHGRAADIASSAKNIGKQYKPAGKQAPDKWVTEVLMRPGYAIATSAKAGVQHGLRVTDIYAYDGQRWHAIFSQDTRF